MKAALIAGGSGGIGSEIVRQAAQSGWNVLIGYNNGQQRADDLAAEIKALGGTASAIHLNLEQPSSIDQALETVGSKLTTLDALVLCASSPPVLAPFAKTEAEEFLRQFKINALGAQILISSCWRKFFYPARSGHVIGILSAAIGPPPWPHMSAYAAGKRAMQSVMESAAAELGRTGLRISALSPTYTETPMLSNLPPLILEAARAKMKNGRFLSAAEVGKRVVERLDNPPEASAIFSVREITDF